MKIYRSNQDFQGPICQFVKWGEKKPERKEKEEEERSGRKVGPGLNGRELGARALVPELPAMSPTAPRRSAPGTLAPRRVSSAPASMVPS